jgi:hypothetical protein
MVICCALAVRSPIQAQAVYGTVVDDSMRAAVVGAEVGLMVQGQRAVAPVLTDSLGRFMLAAPRAGTYGLRVSHASFLTYEVDSIEVGTGEVVTLQVRLGRQTIPLQALVVTARRSHTGLAGFDRRRRAGFGHFITREEITSRAAGRVTDILRNVPGLSFRPLRGGAYVTLMSGGGSGRCAPTVWVDGVQMRETEQSTIDQVLTPALIEAVEVYTSHAAAPTQYVSGLCGVILFWTRQGSRDDGERWQWKKMLAGAGAAVLLIILLAR